MFKSIEFFKGKSRGEGFGLLRSARNDVCSAGRSMIEMLGVLAIIGVLSVGGIAGYSKAMEKWKINKTIEQIEQITYNIFSTYANQKTMEDISSLVFDGHNQLELMKSLGFIPEDMVVDGQLKNLFGGELDIFAGSYYCDSSSNFSHKCEKYVSFELYNISKEACLTLGSMNWAKGSSAVIGVGIASSGENVKTDTSDCWLGSYSTIEVRDWLVVCNKGIIEKDDDIIPLPIPPTIVSQHCACNDNGCYFGVSFTDK